MERQTTKMSDTSRAAALEIVSKIEVSLKAREHKNPVFSQSISSSENTGSKLRKIKSSLNLASSVAESSTSIPLAEIFQIWPQIESSLTAEDREDFFFSPHLPFFELKEEEKNTRSQLKKTKSAPTLASFVEESKASIFTFPPRLVNFDYYCLCKPEEVPIGPYHKGKSYLWEWEEHKQYFLSNYIVKYQKADLFESLFSQLLELENRARSCYRGVRMSRYDFAGTMLVDGCFVIELLYHLTYFEGELDEDNPFCRLPALLPTDLLKLDNQLPYFVLKLLFESGLFPWEQTRDPFHLLALEFFADKVCPIPQETVDSLDDHGTKHLLDLFHSSLNPLTKPTEHSSEATSTEQANRHLNITALLYFLNSLIGKFLSKRMGSYGGTQSVSHLRSLGIEFKSREGINFLDIKFENNVLEIPSIEYDLLLKTFLVNCVAWERAPGNESKSKYISDFVYFMACLLKEPSDVTFLRSAGIIFNEPPGDYSILDKSLSDFVNGLEKDVGYISRDSYLSQNLTKLQWYCNSPMAKFHLKFTSDPLSSLPTFALLILIFSLVQTIRAIFNYLQ